MNLQTIATLFTVIGLTIVTFCVVQAEVSYQRVQRGLKRSRATRGESIEADTEYDVYRQRGNSQ